jgi:hypothetical protein
LYPSAPAQLPDLPLSSVYYDAVVNSLLLLLHVSLPASARLGAGLAARPAPEAALTLAPIRCSAEEVLGRFRALFDALRHLLSPAFAKAGATLPVALSPLLRLLSNVRPSAPLAHCCARVCVACLNYHSRM